MHFIAYFILLILALKYFENVDKSNSDIVGYALYASLLYFFISSPEMYQFVHGLIGNKVSIANGKCPTLTGVFIHSAVFGSCMAVWQAFYPEDSVY
jgi:hypothetical protein